MASPTTYGLAVLLVASLALNARLWTRGTPADGKTKTPAASASAASRAEPDACERRLQACQQQTWQIAQRALAVTQAPKPATPTPPAPKTGRSDLAAQAQALCTKAQQSLRETWQRDRDAIAFGLSQGLSDKEAQEREVVKEAAHMKEITGLSDREAASVERAYREKRIARIAEAQTALTKQDYGALLDATRGLLADEDAILERAGGTAAREAWRAEQVESRTVILALVASMADRDWDDSIHW